jgi:hypothetical protein
LQLKKKIDAIHVIGGELYEFYFIYFIKYIYITMIPNYGLDHGLNQYGIPDGWRKVRSRSNPSKFSYFNITENIVYYFDKLPEKIIPYVLFNKLITESLEKYTKIPLKKKLELIIKSIDKILMSKPPQENIVTIYLNRALSYNGNFNIISAKKYNEMISANPGMNPEHERIKLINSKPSDYKWDKISDWRDIFKYSKPDYTKTNQAFKDTKYQFFGTNFKHFQTVINAAIENLTNKLRVEETSTPTEFAALISTDPKNLIKDDMGNYSYASKINFRDNSKIAIIGDLHSSFHSLEDIIINDLNSKNFFVDQESLILKSNHYIIFTGDVVDRGPYGLEILWFISTLLYLNPDNVYLCKGNHEDIDVYYRYGFKDQMDEQFDVEPIIGEFLFKTPQFLSLLPTVIFGKLNGKLYQFNHGSINLDFSGYTTHHQRFDYGVSKLFKFLNNKEEKNISIQKSSSNNTCGFKWGDFYYNPFNYGVRKPIDTVTGRYNHHHKIIEEYLVTHGIKCIFSGHQDTVSLGILPVEKNKKEIQIDANGDKIYWNKERFLPEMITTGFPETRKFELKKDKYEFPLNPSFDDPEGFLAITMSSAIISKNIEFNTYAILE